jgi:hypothetical protein
LDHFNEVGLLDKLMKKQMESTMPDTSEASSGFQAINFENVVLALCYF